MDLSSIKKTAMMVGRAIYRNRGKIEYISGLAITATGIGLLVKSVLDIQPNLEEYSEQKELVEKNDSLTDEEKTKIIRKNAFATGKEIAKKVAAPAATIIVGEGLQTAGFCTINTQLAETSAALSLFSGAFFGIRDRIIAKEGEEKWAEYANGVGVIADVDPDTGEVKDHYGYPAENLEPFSFFFDEMSINYSDHRGVNQVKVKALLHSLDFMLQTSSEEFVTYFDIMKTMGLPLDRSRYDLRKYANAGIPRRRLDGTINHIDGGLPERNPDGSYTYAVDDATRRFLNGEESVVLLRFRDCVPDIFEYMAQLDAQDMNKKYPD